jgi:GAF domain-containing protein
VPLRVHGEVVGSLNLTRVGGPEAHFSEHEFELSKLFAGQASIALQNAEAHVTVSTRADLDALTGLRNHGTFQRDLAA